MSSGLKHFLFSCALGAGYGWAFRFLYGGTNEYLFWIGLVLLIVGNNTFIRPLFFKQKEY